ARPRGPLRHPSRVPSVSILTSRPSWRFPNADIRRRPPSMLLPADGGPDLRLHPNGSSGRGHLGVRLDALGRTWSARNRSFDNRGVVHASFRVLGGSNSVVLHTHGRGRER